MLILAGALVTVLTSLALGLLFIKIVCPRLAGLERVVLAFLAGCGLLSLTVFLLAAGGLAHRTAFLILDSVALALAIQQRAFSFGASNHPALGRAWRFAAAGLFGVFTFIYLLHAMAPETSPDGSYYHLGFVSLYLDAGRLVKVTDNMYAQFPQGIEMLFLHAFSIGKHSAASLVEFTFLGALGALICSFGRRIGKPLAGLFASFAVYACPIAGWAGTRAYIDVAVAALIFGMFYVLLLWEEGHPDRILVLAGLLAGFACSAKYTAMLALPFGICFILVVLARRRQFAAVPPLAFLLAAAPMFSGWLIRNWIWIGNPFSPFLNRWFPNPYIFPSFEKHYTETLRWPDGLSGWSSLPLQLAVDGSAVQGLVGPLFLLAPIAVLSLRRPEGRRLCLAAAVFAATYPMNMGARFLLPALPFLALAMSLAIAKYPWLTGALILGHAIASYPAVVERYSGEYAVRLGPAPGFSEISRKMPEDEYLRAKLFGYDAARMVDRLVPEGEQVYSFISFPEAYSHKKALMYYTSARANMVSEEIFTAIDATPLFGGKDMASGVSPDLAPVLRAEYKFPRIRTRGIRFVLTSGTPGLLWVVTDIYLLSSGNRVPLAASTHITASHSPWYAWRAFDCSPVTIWSSREAAAPGMHIEAIFPEPILIDGVVLSAPRNQRTLLPVLEAIDEKSRWTALSTHPAVSIDAVLPDLRAAATRQVLREGIGYLLMNEGNLVADDFRKNAAKWQIEAAGSAEGFTLYRIRRL